MVYLRLMTMGKTTCTSFHTTLVKGSHPLQGAFSILMAAETARERDIPLFAAQVHLKQAFDYVDRNQAWKAMKEHGGRKTALGVDLQIVGTTLFENEARTLHVTKMGFVPSAVSEASSFWWYCSR